LIDLARKTPPSGGVFLCLGPVVHKLQCFDAPENAFIALA
jgi:hypothetical protein